MTWSNSLLERMEELFDSDESWGIPSEPECEIGQRTKTLHLAVFVQPFLDFLLDGRKTVESRFSINRCPPYECVESGDLVLVKQSGGPIVAVAEVSNVWFYELDSEARDFIRSRFSRQLCVDGPEFWERKAASCYATLMKFSRVEPVEPIPCSKRDRRGWVVLGPSQSQPSLFDQPASKAGKVEGL